MKLHLKHILLFALPLLFVSCEDFLDKEVDTNLSREEIFSNVNSAPGFLNTTYNSVLSEYNRYGGGLIASASDESVNSSSSSTIRFFNGGITPSYNPDNIWNAMYEGIRRANIFLYELEHTIAESNSIPEKDRGVYKGQALFLRAYCHFELVKRYQMIPYVDEELSMATDFSTDSCTFQLSFNEVVKHISQDCDSAAIYLPQEVGAVDFGRARKVSALALKSRILLYAASPLNNAPSSADYDIEKWQVAADAALAVLDMADNTLSIGLATKFADVFTKTNSSEILFASKLVDGNSFESSNFPISYNGQGLTNPSQNLLDAFGTKNGKPIADDPKYDPAFPYDNRDARLYATILTNDASFKGSRVEAYVGGKDGILSTNNATKTGFYLAKFLNSSIDLDQGTTDYKFWIHFRLGEFYLNYAEALNEYLDAPNSDVHDAMYNIRKRNFLLPFLARLPASLDKDGMRERIRNERQVELAFEGHRFWDLRRWKDLTNLNASIKGMQITKNDDGSFSYQEIPEVEKRDFDERFYFYPIPRAEVLKGYIKQNEFWK